MPDDEDDRNEILEPPPEDIGYCSSCDCEVYLPESPDLLCPHCRADEVVTGARAA